MHNLCIDIGNTSTKIAVFVNRELVSYQRFSDFDLENLIELLKTFDIKKSIISSVDEEVTKLEEYLKKNTKYTRFTTLLGKGLHNKYKTPQTLGLDRWAAIIGAKSVYNDVANLVIDAGSCITYDYLNASHEYFGGSISPGINMRFKAMNYYTGRLPLLVLNEEGGIPEGVDTESAMQNGVVQGIINEIEGYIALNNKKTSALNVILTGGDAEFLYKQLQNSIFAPQIVKDPYLVLKGLNEVIA